tara:strand:+ start:143 stop:463 length:321 start_codon:yes stop_codon:yes gene_type:complete
MNEASMYTLFSKTRGLPVMKRLLEGEGISVENKFGHPFCGFKNAYTLITCNYLPCPFIPPKASTSGYTLEEYECDNKAMNARSKLVEFTQSFHDSGTDEFDEKEWA